MGQEKEPEKWDSQGQSAKILLKPVISLKPTWDCRDLLLIYKILSVNSGLELE